MTVPPSLAALPNWVVWKRETVRGKPTKVPYKTRDYRASVTDPTTWTPLADARTACTRGRFDGIGFVITGTPYTGIDLDWHDRPGDDMPPIVLELIARFDSYAERTPSGKGARILVRGKLPAGARHKVTLEDGVTLEAYSEARYFTVTGDRLTDHTDPQDRQAELDQLVTERLTREPRRHHSASRATVPVDLADADLLDKARSATNGARFQALWDGDLTAYANDHSRADYALINALVFWTNGDAARTDRLFRSSRLMRDKWDERHHGDGRTYGQGTIDNALAAWDGHGYSPRRPSTPDLETARAAYRSGQPLARLRSVLARANAHSLTRGAHLDTAEHLYELGASEHATLDTNGDLEVELGGLRNLSTARGGHPAMHAARGRYLQDIGAIKAIRHRDPRNPRSPLIVILPADPTDLPIYSLDPEGAKSLSLPTTRNRLKNPVAHGQNAHLMPHSLYSRVPKGCGIRWPLRRARWTGNALAHEPGSTVASLCSSTGNAPRTVREHLRALQEAGLAASTAGRWSLTLTPEGFRAAVRSEREADANYRRRALAIQATRRAYHERALARLPRSRPGARKVATDRIAGLDRLILRLEAGEPVYVALGVAA